MRPFDGEITVIAGFRGSDLIDAVECMRVSDRVCPQL